MGHYKNATDTRVTTDENTVKWVDYGEIRHLHPEDARWLANQLLNAAAKAEK